MTKTGVTSRGRGVFLGLLVLAAVGPTGALASGTTDEDFAAFRKKELGELENRLAAIPASAVNTHLTEAARQAASDVDAVVAEVVESLERVRSAAVGSMVVEVVGESTRKPPKATAASHADQVRDIYVKYHDRLAKAAAAVAADSPEARIARGYVGAVLVAAEKFVFVRAGDLEALSGTGDVGAEWGVLMPLLAHEDAAWSKEFVGGLPEWMKKMQSLRAAEYVCLCSGRPRAAYRLWVHQVSGEGAPSLGLEDYMGNLHRRANASFGSKDFLKGIAILKAAALLADSEGMVEEAVKVRFRLAEVYATYGHSQLAADEMRTVMTAYPDHKEHGRAALTRLKYLYNSGHYDKILEEYPAMLEDQAAADYRPQIIYIAWVTSRRQDKKEAVDELQRRLIRDYPDHPLCADLHFSSAMNLLAAGDYAGASRLLDRISERYDGTPIAAKSREILARIKASQQQTSRAETKPGGG